VNRTLSTGVQGGNTTVQVTSSAVRPGYAYVPWQNMTRIYSMSDALRAGTLFPELNIPYGSYVTMEAEGSR